MEPEFPFLSSKTKLKVLEVFLGQVDFTLLDLFCDFYESLGPSKIKACNLPPKTIAHSKSLSAPEMPLVKPAAHGQHRSLLVANSRFKRSDDNQLRIWMLFKDIHSQLSTIDEISSELTAYLPDINDSEERKSYIERTCAELESNLTGKGLRLRVHLNSFQELKDLLGDYFHVSAPSLSSSFYDSITSSGPSASPTSNIAIKGHMLFERYSHLTPRTSSRVETADNALAKRNILQEHCYQEALTWLGDQHDEPESPLSVLAALNLSVYCMLDMRISESRTLLAHAVLMEQYLELGGKWNAHDAMQMETKKRLKLSLMCWDFATTLYCGSIPLMPVPSDLSEYRPAFFPHEDAETRRSLELLMTGAAGYTRLFKLPNIDWRASDAEILSILFLLSQGFMRAFPRLLEAGLDFGYSEEKDVWRQSGGKGISAFTSADLSYYTHVCSVMCQVWLNFLEPKVLPPPNRFNTPIMRELQVTALDACVPVARWISNIFLEIASRKLWCGQSPCHANFVACRAHRLIALHHWRREARQNSLLFLIKMRHVFKCEPVRFMTVAASVSHWLGEVLVRDFGCNF
ncbi:uncharacterized protein VTP21DRAFT_3204 [Calcarisporiella thermophila]|uniref:uncharacterized protein n=1 Tax=Calcarisporiella thermophila TaxID=911321 RepID=UPI0037436F1B